MRRPRRGTTPQGEDANVCNKSDTNPFFFASHRGSAPEAAFQYPGSCSLDKFVKHQLKAKYYLRYADDFLLVGNDPERLLGYFVEINTFLKQKLQLQIHPNKVSLRKLSQGIDFVGYIALPHYQLPRRKTVKRILSKVKYSNKETLEKSLPSYLGYLQHAKGQKIIEQLGKLV